MCKLFTASAKTNFRTIFHLIFEFCEHDLSGLVLNHEIKFKLSEIKNLLKQLLNGVYYIHANKVILI
jgi:cyclin-dependent kinase 9